MASRAATAGSKLTLHESYLRHKGFRWLKLASLLCALSVAVYLLTDAQPRPNGGTALGYALGTVATLLIVWLTLLGVRKRVVGYARYSLKAWTSAHVYLGLSLIAVATLHTGFQFGWNVHTLAYALMLLVIASGIWGVVAYARLPRTLSANRGELTQSQMLDAIAVLDRQLHDAAQQLPAAQTAIIRDSLENCRVGGGLWARLTGKHRGCGNARALKEIRGHPELSPIAAMLERKETMLGQARRHMRTRALLEIWLYVHVPMTFALIAALTAHIVSVFYYW